jgi:hypothetical protein
MRTAKSDRVATRRFGVHDDLKMGDASRRLNIVCNAKIQDVLVCSTNLDRSGINARVNADKTDLI